MPDTGGVSARGRQWATAWDSERVISQPALYFEELFKEIGEAHTEVAFETYIFEAGALAKLLLDRLAGAASRGVRARLLVDGFGSPAWVQSSEAVQWAVDHPGVEVRVFHPLPRLGEWVGPFLRKLAVINERNHRKVCLIDDRVAFVGGMNVATGHLSWRDTGVRVEGEATEGLRRGFEAAWSRASPLGKASWSSVVDSARRRIRHPVKRAWRALVRGATVRSTRRRLLSEFCRRIREADARAWITSPYFIPPRAVLIAIRRAARRGVDVRILVPQLPDVKLFLPAARALYGPLLRAGVRVYEYRPQVLHAKTVLVDSWASVGSTNMNHRSFFHDWEADVVLTQVASIRKLESDFLTDLQESSEVTLAKHRTFSWWSRALGRLLLLLRRWS